MTSSNTSKKKGKPSKSDEWYTPLGILNYVHDFWPKGITLDPCSTHHANTALVKADRYLTKADDALKNSWFDQTNTQDDCRVWLNPPFSDLLFAQFIGKAIGYYHAGLIKELLILSTASTDTKKQSPLQEGLMLFTLGRISFVHPHNVFLPNALYGSKNETGRRGHQLTYFGHRTTEYIETFTADGTFWLPNKNFISY